MVGARCRRVFRAVEHPAPAELDLLLDDARRVLRGVLLTRPAPGGWIFEGVGARRRRGDLYLGVSRERIRQRRFGSWGRTTGTAATAGSSSFSSRD